MSDRSIDEIRQEKMDAMREGASGESAATPDEPIHVDGSADLEATLSEHDVVLADFYADWCGPCKAIEPVVADVAAETSAAVAKVDVDANQRLASQYGVRGVPTLVLFADGEPAERLVGAQSRGALFDVVEQYS